MFVIRSETSDAGARVPLFVAEWVHGRVICTVAVYGKRASVARTLVLARREDARIAAGLAA